MFYNIIHYTLTVGTNSANVMTLEESPSSFSAEVAANEKESFSMSLVVILPWSHDVEESELLSWRQKVKTLSHVPPITPSQFPPSQSSLVGLEYVPRATSRVMVQCPPQGSCVNMQE